MKYSLAQAITLLAGLTAARGIEKRGSSSTTLHGAISDVIDATNTLDHVVAAYSGGEAEEVDCAVNTAVTVLRHATTVANGMAAPMSDKDAEDWKASTVKLCDVGDSLVKTFDGKIDAFNDARICNSITTHVTDLDDQVIALIKAVGSKLPAGSDAAFPNKSKTYFTTIKEGMDRCTSCGVLNDVPYSGVPLGNGSSTTHGAGTYPGPVGISGAATVGASCGGAILAIGLVAFFF